MSKVKEKVENQTQETPNQEAPEKLPPVFEEVEGMTDEAAVGIVIQAANMAQTAGALSVRDSVILAKAISVLRPGTI